MENKCIVHSRISQRKFREILRLLFRHVYVFCGCYMVAQSERSHFVKEKFLGKHISNNIVIPAVRMFGFSASDHI